MSKPVFSLRNMLLGIGVIAISLAMLLTANFTLVLLVWNVLGIVFVATLVAAIILRRERQAFCIGFFVWGVAYLLICINSAGGFELLVTERVIDVAYGALNIGDSNSGYQAYAASYPPYQPPPPWSPPQVASNGVVPAYAPVTSVNAADLVVYPTPVATTTPGRSVIRYDFFRQIGHGIFALLFAIIGGVFAKRLWLRAHDDTQTAIKGAP